MQLDDWLERNFAIRIKHELPDRCGLSAIRHSLRLGEATCARPAGLSGIGIDTLGCTEVESELQMGQEREKENRDNRYGVNAYCTLPQRDGLPLSG